MRIQVAVKVEEPLKLGIFMGSKNGSKRLILAKYECLSDFCYYCGKLGHIDDNF